MIETLNSFLEIGVEDFPTNHLQNTLDQIKSLASQELDKKQIKYGLIESFGSSKRLILTLELKVGREEKIKILGPPSSLSLNENGQFNQKAKAFATSNGLPISSLGIEVGKKGEQIVGYKVLDKTYVENELSNVFINILSKVKFNKSINWGEYSFIRPIRWILSCFEDQIVNLSFGGLKSSNETLVGRVGEKIAVDSYNSYFKALKDKEIIFNNKERNHYIKDLIEKEGFTPFENDRSIEQNANLVESPHLLICDFDSKYLELPELLLKTALEEVHRLIPLKKSEKLTNQFAVVVESKRCFENGKIGIEKSLRFDLEGLLNLFNKDKAVRIEDHVNMLNNISFHNEMGNYGEKVERLKFLAKYIGQIVGADNKVLERGVSLSKSDLSTLVVGKKDYAELRGYMGMVYSLSANEPEEVAKIVYEHYFPRYGGDKLPSTKEGAILAVADKIDNFACAALAKKIPSGTSDPLYVRREVNGVILNILEHSFDVNLEDLISHALYQYRDVKEVKGNEYKVANQKAKEFILTKVEQVLSPIFPNGILKSVESYLLKPFDAKKRGEAILSLYESGKLHPLLELSKRLKNISKGYEKTKFSEKLLKTKYEKDLYLYYTSLTSMSVDNSNYILFLKKAIDGVLVAEAFFDNTMVLVEDVGIKENRVALLKKLLDAINRVGDLIKITY